jgi:alkylation response protein AidB-like acyl-CoA dehydrogenase
MDFNDSPQEAAFRQEVHAWLSAHAKPKTHAVGETTGGLLPDREDPALMEEAKRWQQLKAEAGWAGITWPKAYGGRGGSLIQQLIWNQEEAKFNVPPNPFGLGIGLAGPTLMAHASTAQKERYLKNILYGEEIWCQLFSEPGAGSDLAGLRTRAVRDGDDWVINGQKVWTSGAHYSDLGMLVARTDPDAPKHKGLTYFVCPMHAQGIEIRPIKQITGGANFNEVFFNDVRIPDANRVGAVGQGWSVAITTLMNERMAIGTGGIGMMLDPADIVRGLGAVVIDGKPAIEHAHVRDQAAYYLARFKAMELTGYRTLTALSQGSVPGPEGSIMKLAFGLLTQEAAALMMELQGACGVCTDPAVNPLGERWHDIYLSVPAMRIAGGSDEIQRNIIGERVLGLPPDVRLDKGKPFKEVPTGPGKAGA